MEGTGKTIALVVVVIVVGLVFLVWGSYNSLVGLDVSCDEAWSQVQTQYQRRYDLIPNVIDTTKMYINYEKELLTDITEARSRWADALGSSMENQMTANREMDSVLDRLFAIVSVENYPELKADQVVMTLIDELEGTENRISVARMRYNEAVADYNRAVRMFPTNIFAGMFRFDTRPFFEAVTGAEEVPKVGGL